MTNNNHPITPPPELVEEWANAAAHEFDIATQAARWGADTELEACCTYLAKTGLTGDACGLQLTRRPKPPSLKARLSKAIVEGDERQALKLLEELDDSL